MLNANDFFLCYSYEMKNYLKSKGMKYILSGKDRRNGQTFYVFERIDALVAIVRNWDSISKELVNNS